MLGINELSTFAITIIIAVNGVGEKHTFHERFASHVQCEQWLETYVDNLESQGAFVSLAECGEKQ